MICYINNLIIRPEAIEHNYYSLEAKIILKYNTDKY